MTENPDKIREILDIRKYLKSTAFIPATMPGNQYTKPVEANNIFVPSMSGMENRSFLKLKDGDRKYDISWWRLDENDEPLSFYYYPYLLVSYWYGKDNDDFRAKFGMPPKDKFEICGDSGGFQVVTQNVTVDPIECLRWQEKNCNWGFTLDIPPLLRVGDGANSWSLAKGGELVSCQEKTAKNAKIMYDAWEDDDYEMVFVAHGYRWKQMMNAREVLKKTTELDFGDFSGISISCKDSHALNIAQGCLYGINNLDDGQRFHYLGLSGYKTTMILIYAFTYRPDINLTMDSSSYGSQGNIRRVYWMDDMKNVLEFGKNNTSYIKNLPCNCPICRVVLNPEVLRNPGSLPGGLISLHNLYVYVNFVEKLKALSTNPIELRRYIIKNVPSLKTALDFIDLSMDKGFDMAFDRYARDIKRMSQKSSARVATL